MKTENGITLISLIITIIVMLILAAVSLSTVVGEGSIINKGIDAKTKTIIGQVQEIGNLGVVKAQTEDYKNMQNIDSVAAATQNIRENGYTVVTENQAGMTVTGLKVLKEGNEITSFDAKQGQSNKIVVDANISLGIEKNYVLIENKYYEILKSEEGKSIKISEQGVESTTPIINNKIEIVNISNNLSVDKTVVELGNELNIIANSGGTGSLTLKCGDVVKELIVNIENALLIDIVKLGDYVEYSPTVANCKVEYVGLDTAQTFEPVKYTGKWRVININKNTGVIEIVSAESVGDLKLKGGLGYGNGVKRLNEISESYINPEFADSARSIGYMPGNPEIMIYPKTWYMSEFDGHFNYSGHINDTDYINSIEKSGIGEEYWMGVRFINGDGAGGYLGIYAHLKGTLQKYEYGGFYHEMGKELYYNSFVDQTIVDWDTTYENDYTYGVRPVVGLKTGYVADMTNSDGSINKPWILKK